jgi:hypothetical protein
MHPIRSVTDVLDLHTIGLSQREGRKGSNQNSNLIPCANGSASE